MNRQPEAPTSDAPPASGPPAPARNAPVAAPVPSEHLLQGRRTIEISHNGAVYRLQATKQGKLILTK